MKTLILDATTKSITAVMSGAPATTNPDFTSAYADVTATTFTEGANDGTLNGATPVTIVAAPAASTRRVVKSITIQNRDTAPVIVTLRYVSAGGIRQIWKGTLAVGDTWTPEGVYDTNGNLKTLGGHAAWVSAAAPTVNDDANDGFTIGSRWVDTTNKQMYICVDATVGAAVWQNITSKLYASDGSPVALSADAAGALTAAIAPFTLTGGQLAFPASQNASADANTLDDYEEGTWTATLTCGTSGTITMNSDLGTYTKIGGLVTVHGYFSVASVSSPVGELILNGLPFVIKTSNQYYTAAAIYCAIMEATAATQMMARGIPNTSTMYIRHFAAGVIAVAAADVKALTQIVVTMSYIVA